MTEVLPIENLMKISKSSMYLACWGVNSLCIDLEKWPLEFLLHNLFKEDLVIVIFIDTNIYIDGEKGLISHLKIK